MDHGQGIGWGDFGDGDFALGPGVAAEAVRGLASAEQRAVRTFGPGPVVPVLLGSLGGSLAVSASAAAFSHGLKPSRSPTKTTTLSFGAGIWQTGRVRVSPLEVTT